jgi:hypothetical protein
MKASEAWIWKFTKKPADDSEVKCPECEIFSPLSEWTDGEGSKWCETCGYHNVMSCPKCGYEVEHINQNGQLEVRQTDEVK